MKSSIFNIFFLACLATISATGVAGSLGKKADILLFNAKVYTLDASQPWAEALAVSEGKIVAVGSSALIEEYRHEDTEELDLGGKMVMPGIIDAHAHPVWGGIKALYQCNFPFTAGKKDIAETISRCVDKLPDAEWILGGQWDSNFFVNNQIDSPKAFLDVVSGDKAVVLNDDSGHNYWVNSKALAMLGIDNDTEDFPGVTVVRHPVSGEPNGLLMEGFKLISSVIPRCSSEQCKNAAQYANKIANSYGVTGVKDASATPDDVKAFYQLDQEHKLTMHVATSLYQEIFGEKQELDIEKYVNWRDSYRSANVHTNFVKIFLDGVPTVSRTAAMLAPYRHIDGEHADHFGTLHVEQEALAELIAKLDALGFTVKIHTAGDRSVRVTLNAIAQARKLNGQSGLRHELAHAGFVSTEDVPRFASLNAVADFSPILWFPSPIIDSVVGAVGERGKYYWPTRDLIDSGALLLSGSDWPAAVPDMNPWGGIESLVTRKDPRGVGPGFLWKEQAINLEEAIKIYTIENARALRLDTVTGSIEVGKFADFIVLDQHLFSIPAERIGDTKAIMTFFKGRLVYSAE